MEYLTEIAIFINKIEPFRVQIYPEKHLVKNEGLLQTLSIVNTAEAKFIMGFDF